MTEIDRIIEEVTADGNPIMNGFIITALERFSETLVSKKASYIKENQDSFVNPEMWVNCGEKILKSIRKGDDQ